MLKRIVNPGMQVIDIGANIGYYTILFAKLVGKHGKVYAFEPDSLNFRYLEKNTKKYKNVVLNNLAVGEKRGELLLFHSHLLNVDHQTYDSGENRIATKVKCIAIDDYSIDAKKVDVIKVDIQGYEYFAIKGMTKMLENSANVTIIAEFWPYGLKKAGLEPNCFLELLENMGFEIKFEGGLKKEELFKKVDDYLFYIDVFATKKSSKAYTT